MGGTDFATNLIAPLIGTIFCLIMWFSPLTAILKAREAGSLGPLNPLPFGII